MPHQKFLAIASAVLAAVTLGEARILSCADVDCPIASGSTSANCTVVDKAFDAVGVATLDTAIEGFNDLSWLKAVGAQDIGEKRRVFDQSFYLGTPDDFDLGGAGACALFFSEVSDRVRFGDDDARRTTGTCGQALTDSCVSALVDRAKAVDLDGLSSTAACQKLGRDFSDNLDAKCSSFATGKKWTGIKAQGRCHVQMEKSQSANSDRLQQLFPATVHLSPSRTSRTRHQTAGPSSQNATI